MAILAVKNLSKSYKNQKVLKDINITIDSPGIWALVGPNGSGKTTFLNVVNNLLPATGGTVKLVGKSNTDVTVFKEVSFLQDNTVLFEYLSGYDHLKYICDVHNLKKKQIEEVAEYVGMKSYLMKKVGDYSLGMKQHLLLAMSIINQPRLLFLDEPLNGLDPTSAILMRKILLELAEKGTTIILSSHNLAEIDKVTKQIIFLKDGQLLQEDMNVYEKIYYSFTLSNMSEALQILTDKGYQAELLENELKVQIDNQYLQTMLDVLKDSAIEILDMQKEVSGSEKRYAELFEV